MEGIKKKFANVKDQLRVSEEERERLEIECAEWKTKYEDVSDDI